MLIIVCRGLYRIRDAPGIRGMHNPVDPSGDHDHTGRNTHTRWDKHSLARNTVARKRMGADARRRIRMRVSQRLDPR
jgi:hypothetical protein